MHAVLWKILMTANVITMTLRLSHCWFLCIVYK